MSDQKQPKKKINWIQVFLVLVFTAIGLLCGILMAQMMDKLPVEQPNPLMRVAVCLLFMLVLYLLIELHIVAHEAGHLIFGLATGYRFVSFRVGSLILLKDEQGYRLRKLRLNGTGGQCLLAPPDMVDGKMPYVLYNLGGCLMNLLCALTSGAVALLCRPDSISRIVFFVSAIIALLFALVNGLPIPGEISNDGRNALSLGKNPAALEALRVQLLINQGYTCGTRLKDMPEAWFRWPSAETRTNDLVIGAALLCANRLLDEHRLEECTARLEELLGDESNRPAGLHQKLILNDLVFCYLLGDEKEKAEALMTKEQQSFMKAMKGNLPVHRTDYAYALLAQQDEAKASKMLAVFNKVVKHYPYEAEIQLERELLAMADEKALRA